MNCNCDRADLHAALNAAKRATSRDTEVRGCVLLEADGDTLSVSASNGSVQIRASINAHVSVPGTVMVPAATLSDFVARLDDGAVSIEDANTVCNLRCGSAHSAFSVVDPEQFPKPIDSAEVTSVPVDAYDLAELINLTSFAASLNDPARPVYTCARTQIGDGKITMAALDGYRMAVADKTIDTGESSAACNIPVKALRDIRAILPVDDVGAVTLTIGANTARFDWPGMCITVRLIEGAYMDYEQAMPTESAITCTLDRQTFLGVLARANVIAYTPGGSPVVTLSIHDNTINVSAGRGSSSAASCDETFAAKTVGEPITISLNPTFLLDALKVLPAEDITMVLNSPTQGVLLTNDFGYRYLALPVQTR